MKTSSKFLAILAASAFAFSPLALHAQDQPPPPPMDNGAPPPPPDNSAAPAPDANGGDDSGASFQEFYDQLGSQGQWIQTPNYGYAFQPSVTDPNWAPYTEGHWAYTDVGWTWVSDEPWGWATYHYGRWVNIDGTGWVWVPGYTWAPAWVSWRYGGGYCGWAPLPPATMVGVDFGSPGVNIGIGFYFGSDVDTSYGIGPGWYNFIPVTYIGDPSYHGYYLDRSRNYVVINQTRNVTNIHYYSGRPVFGGVNAGGPSLAEVNGQAHTPIQQVRLTSAAQAGRSSVAGGTLSVYAPRFNPATVRQAHPTTVARTLSSARINRGTSITHPLAVNASIKPAAPSAEAIHAAQEAQAQVPASAHIATASTLPKTRLTKPLPSLQTASELRHATGQSNAGGAGYHSPAAGTAEHPTSVSPSGSAQGAAEEAEQAQRERAAAAQQEQEQAQARERAAATEEQRSAPTEEQRPVTQERPETEERPVPQEHTPEVQQHAPVVQQHAPVTQQRAPAPAQHPAAAQGGGEKNKNPNNQ